MDEALQEILDWLKSLRPQNGNYHEGFKAGFAKAKGMGYNHWKPSEEQMETLGYITTVYMPHNDVIKSLYNDLKTL